MITENYSRNGDNYSTHFIKVNRQFNIDKKNFIKFKKYFQNNFPEKINQVMRKKFKINKDKTKVNWQSCLQKSKFVSTIKNYCSTSSLHGLKYIGDSNLSIFERFFWMISFLAALIAASIYIWSIYYKWISSPIIISVSPEPVSFQEFPFPSVTLCNMNNARKSEAERINRGSDESEKLLLDDICNNEEITGFDKLDDEFTMWNNVRNFMINVSQSCDEMLHFCQWHGDEFPCNQLFNPSMTDEGICCNFNSVHREYLFYNPDDWSDLNSTYSFSFIDWTPENGYNSQTPPDSIPWRSYGAGKFLGLTLVIDANIEEYYCSSTASAGFKILLHNPVETPKITDFALSISSGVETHIIIHPQISVAKKSILNIPLKKRKCFFSSERKLRYYRTYTQRNCFLECEANFTQKICQCVQYYMPKSYNTSICGKKDDPCAILARRAMEVKLFDDEDRNNQLNITETPSCNCWPGCYEVNYLTEISHSKLITGNGIKKFYVKKNQHYFVENMAVVHLYFVNSQFTKYMKNELFGFTEFLSNTGGLLGLFMGFSVLSFMEIIYFIIPHFWCHPRQKKELHPHQNIQIQLRKIDKHQIYPFTQ